MDNGFFRRTWSKLRRRDLFLFGAYTYLEKFLWYFLNLFPKIIRHLALGFLLSEKGRRVFIDEECYFRYPWKIRIGDNVIINRGCTFYPSLAEKNAYITIGNGSIIGPNVVFLGAGQDPNYPSTKDVAGSIKLGARVYVGGNSTIRYGVSIGDDAVIACGSVVVTDIPSSTICGGVPARVIREKESGF
jgi:acetyltransferase-like isoleucine patch superfamily enzyme